MGQFDSTADSLFNSTSPINAAPAPSLILPLHFGGTNNYTPAKTLVADPLCTADPSGARISGTSIAIENLILPTINGEPLKLGYFRGRILVLHFWWSQCSNCKSTFQTLSNTRARYSEERLAFIGAAKDHDKTRVERIARDYGLDWAQCANENRWMNALWESSPSTETSFTLPRCWIFDGQGKLRFNVHPRYAEGILDLLMKETK